MQKVLTDGAAYSQTGHIETFGGRMNCVKLLHSLCSLLFSLIYASVGRIRMIAAHYPKRIARSPTGKVHFAM